MAPPSRGLDPWPGPIDPNSRPRPPRQGPRFVNQIGFPRAGPEGNRSFRRWSKLIRNNPLAWKKGPGGYCRTTRTLKVRPNKRLGAQELTIVTRVVSARDGKSAVAVFHCLPRPGDMRLNSRWNKGDNIALGVRYAGPNSSGVRLVTEAFMTWPRDIESPTGMLTRPPRFDELTVNGMFRRRAGRTTLKQPRHGDGTVTLKSEMTSQTQAIKHLVPESRRPRVDLARRDDDEHAQIRGWLLSVISNSGTA